MEKIWKNIGRVFNHLWKAVEPLFSSEECLCCGRNAFAVPLCRSCRNDFIHSVTFMPEVRCCKCGKVLVSEHGECLQCREKCVAESLDAVYPLHMYRLWKKELVFSWKMLEERRLSYFFAEAIYHSVRKLGFEHLFFVPVPPRPGKIKDKG